MSGHLKLGLWIISTLWRINAKKSIYKILFTYFKREKIKDLKDIKWMLILFLSMIMNAFPIFKSLFTFYKVGFF